MNLLTKVSWHTVVHTGQADQLESRCQLSIPRRQLAANTTIKESPSGHLKVLQKYTICCFIDFISLRLFSFERLDIVGWWFWVSCFLSEFWVQAGWHDVEITRRGEHNVYFCQISFYIKLPSSCNKSLFPLLLFIIWWWLEYSWATTPCWSHLRLIKLVCCLPSPCCCHHRTVCLLRQELNAHASQCLTVCPAQSSSSSLSSLEALFHITISSLRALFQLSFRV